MNQAKKNINLTDSHDGQVFYCGSWVDKNIFRAWVYDVNGNQKLAESYPEFERLTTSGIWFGSEQEIQDKKDASLLQERKLKDALKLSNRK